MRRAVLTGSGVFYVALAAASARITFAERRMGEDQSAREWTAWVMAQPLGRGIIALIGVGFAAVAIGLAAKAVRAPLSASAPSGVDQTHLGGCARLVRNSYPRRRFHRNWVFPDDCRL